MKGQLIVNGKIVNGSPTETLTELLGGFTYKCAKGMNGYYVEVSYIKEINANIAFNQKSVYIKFIHVDEPNLIFLKQDILNIHDYYAKWSIVAKENNVKEVEKEFPFKVTAFNNVPQTVELLPFSTVWHIIDSFRMNFIVSDYSPKCVLNIINDKGHVVDRHFFSGNELIRLYENIENTFKKKKNFDLQQQNTKDLFR